MHAGKKVGRALVALLAGAALAAGSIAGASAAAAAAAGKGRRRGGGGGGTSLPNSVAALGDSITQASMTCFTLYTCPVNSWSTGSDSLVQSHVTRLKALGAKIRSTGNYAVPGAESADLPGQASRAVSQGAKYVTVLIGANDACADSVGSMTPVASFRSSIDSALSALASSKAQPVVFVASIPNLQRLWDINVGYPSSLSSITSRCPALAQDQAAVQAQVDAYNAELAAACSATARCMWDGGAVANTDFTRADLASDSFHPSRSGQAKLASVTWEAGPWTP
ncbi:GDSL-type esterase/lipase family protein [Microbacterium sp. Marseille-Q6648]|uniref:GDSL-type esterase/lipase family protein n=1 Tax=Microbacterium sp. Marseille-Q6648 TaxID=2937991 RepID=UPI00203DA5C4|nr:GDSL-type esterase/lipase family protein [Microbacterium sp. Marseille-Q6648]